MPDADALMLAAAAAIQRGDLVGMPTETVYGLAADARNVNAVAKVFAAKQRPHFDPLIVHVADPAQAWSVAVPDARAERLAAACWPGPLTLVLPRRPGVPDLVTSGLETVAVRCPAHPLAQALIAASGRPLAAPSANRFGRISPTTAAHVREQLGDAVAMILDGGPCAVGVESTVLVTQPTPAVLRPGGVSCETLAEILGEPVAIAASEARAAALPAVAPGLLASHYAPRIPLSLRADGQPWSNAAEVAILALTTPDTAPAGPCEILSPSGDLTEAAANLFAAMRRLDASGASRIEAERVPAIGIGQAINDRLQRAAGLG